MRPCLLFPSRGFGRTPGGGLGGRCLGTCLAMFLGLLFWVGTAAAAGEKMPDVGQPYGWWYSQGGFQRGGGGPGGRGGGGGGGGGERRGGGGGGGRPPDAGGGGGRPGGGRPPLALILGVSGAASPERAPVVYYRLTPRGGEEPQTVRQAAAVKNEAGLWQVSFAPPAGGFAEVFSSFELGGTTMHAQINVMVSGAPEDAPSVDPEASVPADWPKIVLPDENGMPMRGLMIGQSVDFLVTGEGESGKSLAVEENGYGPPEPLSLLADRRGFSYTANEVETEKTEGTPGRQVVFLVERGGKTVTFSLGVSYPRVSRAGTSRGLALSGGAGVLTACLVAASRRKFKFNLVS